MSDLTQTVTADPIIAQTQHSPSTESFESVLAKQHKKRPNIERTDLKSLEALPETVAPTNLEEVSTQQAEDFLKQMDGGSVTPVDDEPKQEKKTKAVKEEDSSNLDFSDIDFSKDPEPVVETKSKKTKEDNIAELRKKAEAYEASLKEKDTEVLSYREKLEKLEAELERTAFERSPKFKQKYEQPYQTAIEQASSFAKEFGDDEKIAEKALSLKGRERLEFIDESFGGGAASAQFLSLINDADSKRGNLETALSDYRATASEIQQAEIQQQHQTEEQINRNFDRVKDHLSSKTDFFRMTGDDEHDSAVKARIDAARAIIHGNASQNEMTVAPFLSVIAREAVSENAKLKAEIAKYKARAAEDSKVQPRIARGSSDDEQATFKGKPKSALESIRSQLR